MFANWADGIGYMALQVKVAKRCRQRVEQLDAAGCCVKCGVKPPPEQTRRKGRCPKCYYAYRRRRFELPLAERPLFDARLIRAGELMPDRQGQRLAKGA